MLRAGRVTQQLEGRREAPQQPKPGRWQVIPVPRVDSVVGDELNRGERVPTGDSVTDVWVLSQRIAHQV
jgi:hypothetical protein